MNVLTITALLNVFGLNKITYKNITNPPFSSWVAGTVDSNWVVGATLEKKLVPLPLTLALGAFLNHRKNKFQCGFGVTIG